LAAERFFRSKKKLKKRRSRVGGPLFLVVFGAEEGAWWGQDRMGGEGFGLSFIGGILGNETAAGVPNLPIG
jgi:hypothetical protein